jgi:hypothetical protein
VKKAFRIYARYVISAIAAKHKEPFSEEQPGKPAL